MEKLYDSFSRLEETRNRNIEGTGLGLNITKQLVDMMDGTMEVKSEYGSGTEFTVVIPQKCVNEEPIGDFGERIEKASHEREAYRPRLYAPSARILITDDNEMNLEVITGLLEETHISVTCAMSGPQCLECLQKESFDVIFLDQMMPQMAGIQTLKVIKDEDLAKGAPVIALTADAIVGAREIYIREGFADYLSKPVMYEDLENLLFKYLPADRIESEDESEDSRVATVLAISDSPANLSEIRKILGNNCKGVFVRNDEQARQYMSKHAVRYVIRDGGENE
jgi:CheY-like chemotaxis protein